jgi:hypothetical protein
MSACTQTLPTLESAKVSICVVCDKQLLKSDGDFRRYMKKHNP